MKIVNPELTFATADHSVSSAPGRTATGEESGAKLVAQLKEGSHKHGIRYFDVGQEGHGIVHVIGPELGIALPGMTLVCSDSHTSTNGGVGCLAFYIVDAQFIHVLATQTVRQRKPKTMRISFEGKLTEGVTAKDMMLHLLGRIGVTGGAGYAIEYAGSAVRSLGVEARMTMCNLTIELGSKIGFVAPDEKTFEYVKGRANSPQGEMFERAVAHWRTLPSDEGAVFDREIVIDAASIAPTITWGTNPAQVITIDDVIPNPTQAPDSIERDAWRAALEYMGLEPGIPIAGIKIDQVFIGSCTNSRLSDLQDAARVLDGRHVAEGVKAWVVPGSELVKRKAEEAGLDRIFLNAGFEWREPGCSLCVAQNGEEVASGARCVSTSNRNFVGRQGPGARTHLASPVMAAAAAVTGVITDVRKL